MIAQETDVVVFLGPPGIGKGTQAKIISEEYGYAHISTGELIREEIAAGSDVGKLMIEAGKSDPVQLDRLVLQSVEDCLQKAYAKKIILDGCPRSVIQAEGLEEMFVHTGFNLKVVIEFFGDQKALFERMLGRYACASCKAIYHDSTHPTAKEGICDHCGSDQLYRRPEDSREMLQQRITNYEAMTVPMIKYYQTKNVVRRVNGMQSVDGVTQAILKLLQLT